MFSKFTTTGIGSLPHKDETKACELILKTFDIPFWPQLPKSSYKQAMIPQYSEGMPFLKLDMEKERIWIERDDSEELNRFYETYDDTLTIPIGHDYASGFYEMMRQLQGKSFEYLKGQITGPLTFTLGLKDSSGRYIFYDEELREIALMLLKAKARWQIEELKKYSAQVIIFIDEPILSAIGSSTYLGVSEEETFRLLKEIINGIKDTGALAGIHCCGKADWEIVLDANPDILNFDAYGYFDTIEIYYERLSEFISSGDYLAWGIVPTTTDIRLEDIESIHEKFRTRLESLSKNIAHNKIISHTLLTPSCGTGSLNEEEAEKVFALLKELKETLLEKM